MFKEAIYSNLVTPQILSTISIQTLSTMSTSTPFILTTQGPEGFLKRKVLLFYINFNFDLVCRLFLILISIFNCLCKAGFFFLGVLFCLSLCFLVAFYAFKKGWFKRQQQQQQAGGEPR